MADLKKLLDDRGAAIKAGRDILNKAEAENRELSADEQTQYDKSFADAAKLKKQIDTEQSQRELEREAAESALANSHPNNGGDGSDGGSREKNIPEKEFRNFLRTGIVGPELRALQADSDPGGGYTVAPEMFVTQLIKAIDDLVFIRSLATVIPIFGHASLGAPSLDNDPADAAWTPEIGAVSEDSTMTFGKRELTPHQLTKLVKVAMKLLEVSALAIDALVIARLAYKFAITEEKAFNTGSGAGQPLGVFTASNDGIPTGRDVSTDNTTTAMTADGILNNFYNLKAAYRRNADWLFHRDGVKNVSKLKDGNGQYIWRPGLVEGEPDRLLGRPVNESEYAPNTFTTGLYVGILGDFTYYWIADSLSFSMQRLMELYAGNNQVGFIGRAYVDGMPVLGEAFSRVKLA